jgi:hypothetical protein
LAFNVHSDDSWGSKLAINTSRNTFIEKMHEHYGDNVVVLDCPSKLHFDNFSKQFNEQFADKKPTVHFVGSHHTNHHAHKDTYNKELADFIKSIDAGNKRATILSCGPQSSLFENIGCEYVIIPRANGEILGPEFDLKISPAYREAIGWMKDISDPEVIRKKLTETSIDNTLHFMRDSAYNLVRDVYFGESLKARQDPVVVVPQGIPSAPKQNLQAPAGP